MDRTTYFAFVPRRVGSGRGDGRRRLTWSPLRRRFDAVAELTCAPIVERACQTGMSGEGRAQAHRADGVAPSKRARSKAGSASEQTFLAANR